MLQFVTITPGAHCQASSQHQDDLLFFVKSGGNNGKADVPFFVRRKAKQLPDELQLSGSGFSSVDWKQTVLLNIILQSEYQLTVVACGYVMSSPTVSWCHGLMAQLLG